MLARFERLGWHNTSPRHAAFRKPQPDALVTERRQAKIQELVGKLGWDDNPAHVAGFAQKVIRRPWPQTRAERINLINGLAAMVRKASAAANLLQASHLVAS